MREAGGVSEKDYIPIKKADDAESGRGKRGPRLVREEDEEEEGEDRLSFTVKAGECFAEEEILLLEFYNLFDSYCRHKTSIFRSFSNCCKILTPE